MTEISIGDQALLFRGKGARIDSPDFSRIETPPPLPIELRPSRANLEPFIPRPELFVDPHLKHHGTLHGESTEVWAGVLLERLRNFTYNDVPGSKNSTYLSALEGVDEKVLFLAASHHDCGRATDWGYHNGEMTKHGPRGAEIVKTNWQTLDPTLTPDQIEELDFLIRFHTPSPHELTAMRRASIDSKSQHSNTVGQHESKTLMLLLLREADRIELTRTWYTEQFPKITGPLTSRIRTGQASRVARAAENDKRGHISRGLVMEGSRALLPLADALASRVRHDPELIAAYPNNKPGIALEGAQRLGILKP